MYAVEGILVVVAFVAGFIWGSDNFNPLGAPYACTVIAGGYTLLIVWFVNHLKISPIATLVILFTLTFLPAMLIWVLTNRTANNGSKG